ncbi:hypothetical protein SALB1_2983 [Salinisphaera sp. LB1]|nr:hypothetical protein SALB1_2983 [Salinisphaera sp. LB1]
MIWIKTFPHRNSDTIAIHDFLSSAPHAIDDGVSGRPARGD